MEKLDKVIRGLECCINGENNGCDVPSNCPYGDCNVEGTCECILELEKDALDLLKEYRERVPVKKGDVIYEVDGEHGVVTHTITEVLWVANSEAVDDAGNRWADQWSSGDESLIHRTRESAEVAQEEQ